MPKGRCSRLLGPVRWNPAAIACCFASCLFRRSQPRASDRMRLDRDHCSACGDMARQRQGVSADIGPYIDEDAALRRVRAQKIQLYNVVLRIEQRAALGRARLMVKSK